MATLLEVHDALAARLETISGLRAFAYPPQSPSPPVAWPQFAGWEPQDTLDGRGPRVYKFTLLVLTAGTTRPQDGYQLLMEYLEPVALAIWDGNTTVGFGGLEGVQARVTRLDVLGRTQIDELQMYGGQVDVDVVTKP